MEPPRCGVGVEERWRLREASKPSPPLAPGNEVALTWLSIAGGYSAGATIFEILR